VTFNLPRVNTHRIPGDVFFTNIPIIYTDQIESEDEIKKIRLEHLNWNLTFPNVTYNFYDSDSQNQKLGNPYILLSKNKRNPDASEGVDSEDPAEPKIEQEVGDLSGSVPDGNVEVVDMPPEVEELSEEEQPVDYILYIICGRLFWNCVKCGHIYQM